MKANEVPAGAVLRQRHRNNPRGEWQPLASLAERLPQRVIEARVTVRVPLSRPEFGSFEELRWVRVEFPRGGHGRRSAETMRRVAQAGAAAGGRRAAKKKEKKKTK